MSRTAETAGIGLAQATVDPRSFALDGDGSTPRLRWFTEGLRRLMIERGYHEHPEPGPEVQVVLNRIDPERPRPVPAQIGADVRRRPRRRRHAARRRAARRLPAAGAGARQPGRDGERGRRARCALRDPRAGHVRRAAQGDDDEFFAGVFERMEPLASSRLVIANEFLRRPGARAVGRRRAHRARSAGGGRAARRARPPAGGVPDRGDPLASVTSGT